MANHVETWKGIAHTVGRSERTVRNLTARPHDPLPVFKVGGIVRLHLADLDAWLDRQRAAGVGGEATAVEEHW